MLFTQSKEMKFLNACEITAFITAFSNILAQKLGNDELNLLAAIFSQIGDTLETIAAQRELCCSDPKPSIQ